MLYILTQLYIDVICCLCFCQRIVICTKELRHILNIEITVLFLNGLSAIKNNSRFSTKIL